MIMILVKKYSTESKILLCDSLREAHRFLCTQTKHRNCSLCNSDTKRVCIDIVSAINYLYNFKASAQLKEQSELNATLHFEIEC